MVDEATGEIKSDFMELIERLKDGGKLGDIDADLARAVESTRAYGDKSSITITLEVVLFKKNATYGEDEPASIVIKPDIKIKEARPTLEPEFVHALPGGQLSQHDPRQARLFDTDQSPRIMPIDRKTLSAGG